MHAVPIVPQRPDEGVEQPIDVVRRPRAGLHELATEPTGELRAVLSGDFTLLDLVAFVPDEDVDGVLALDAEHGLTEDFETVESGSGGYGVDEDEALAFANPLISEGSVLLLTSGIDDLDKARRVIDRGLFPISVLDGWIVGLDEDTQHILYSERGLTDASIAQNCDSPIVHRRSALQRRCG